MSSKCHFVVVATVVNHLNSYFFINSNKISDQDVILEYIYIYLFIMYF